MPLSSGEGPVIITAQFIFSRNPQQYTITYIFHGWLASWRRGFH